MGPWPSSSISPKAVGVGCPCHKAARTWKGSVTLRQTEGSTRTAVPGAVVGDVGGAGDVGEVGDGEAGAVAAVADDRSVEP